MSTRQNTYVMLGILYPYPKGDDEAYERLEPFMDSASKPPRSFDEITVLFDGMSGKYLAIGYVLARTDEYEGFERPVTIPRDVNFNTRIAQIFEQFPPASGTKREDYKEGWHVITHYR